MLAEAKKYDANVIDYVCSPADNMPFANESFDVITSFGAFHWFCDAKSIAEIKRVLKNSGLIFIINKNDISDFRQKIINIASQHTTVKQASQKEAYFPEEILAKYGFTLVKEQNIETIEYYDLTQVIGLAQSMRFWQHLPSEIKPAIIDALQAHFSAQLVDRHYPRPLKISIVQGNKYK